MRKIIGAICLVTLATPAMAWQPSDQTTCREDVAATDNGSALQVYMDYVLNTYTSAMPSLAPDTADAKVGLLMAVYMRCKRQDFLTVRNAINANIADAGGR